MLALVNAVILCARADAQPYLGMPGDQIISQDRLGDEMFLLSKGQVQILVKDPSHVAASDGQNPDTNRAPIYASAMHGMVFCDGAFFGELPVLGKNPKLL
jgi:hypothetical protein